MENLKLHSEVGFAIWLTGIPSSGKSTIAQALGKRLKDRGIKVEVLESDRVRKFIPQSSYTEEGRDAFYRALIHIGKLLVKNGINVVFDATANKRIYRDEARSSIPKFVEVYVKCPLEVAMKRDPKELYKKALSGEIKELPGLQARYEEPLSPEVVINSVKESPEDAAIKIELKLKELKLI